MAPSVTRITHPGSSLRRRKDLGFTKILYLSRWLLFFIFCTFFCFNLYNVYSSKISVLEDITFSATSDGSSSSSSKREQYEATVCSDVISKQSAQSKFHDPNKGLEESPKKLTITQPPFWISLHAKWFDERRWSSIYMLGEYYEKGLTTIFQNILVDTKEPGLVVDIGK
mmetsp:Transcript_24578/g.35731  ORF Transcript_24578/g.35731 Transcript_24578/m.35731 type:complete len:169 (-) Transcript_24578:916-1422(-)